MEPSAVQACLAYFEAKNRVMVDGGKLYMV